MSNFLTATLIGFTTAAYFGGAAFTAERMATTEPPASPSFTACVVSETSGEAVCGLRITAQEHLR